MPPHHDGSEMDGGLPCRPSFRGFGISVPVKTGVPYLSSALESLYLQGGLAQVALLDASGDADIARLAARYEPMIQYRRHADSDQGQSAAIIEGWNHLHSSYLGWLNVDDVLFPGALARVQREFDADPLVDVVYGDSVFTDENGAFIGYFPSISEDLDRLGSSCIISQPACFIRRKALARVGGLDAGLCYTMDWDLWLRLRDAGCRFRRIAAPLAAVRILSQAKTFSGGGVRRQEIDRILAANCGFRQRIKSHLGHLRYETMAVGAPWAQLLVQAFARGTRLFTLGFPPTTPNLYGLDPSSNRIHGEARISLPLLSRGERNLLITLDRPAANLVARLDDCILPLSPGPDRTVWSAPIGEREIGVLEVCLSTLPEGLAIGQLSLSPSALAVDLQPVSL